MDRFRVSATLAVTTAVVLGVIAAGTAVGWAVLGSSDPGNETPGIRAASAALALSRHARSLADTAAARTQADISPEAMAASKASIDADAGQARQQLDSLASAGQEDAAAQMGELLDELMQKALQLENARPQFAEILRDSETNRERLIAATSWQLLPAALASEDDLFYRILSGRSDTERPVPEATGAVSVEDLLLYARLALLTQQIDQGYIALEVATRQTDSEFIGTVEEAVNLVMYQLRESIESLSDAGHEDLDPTLVPLSRDLVDTAYGESNLIDLMKTRLRLDEQEAQLAEAVNAVSLSLQTAADAVFEQAIGDMASTSTNGDTAPALQAAFAATQHASAVASHTSGPTTANTPTGEMPEIRDAIGAHLFSIRDGLNTLGNVGYGATVAGMHPEIDRFESVAEQILSGRPELAGALQSAARERAQLRSFVDYQLEPAVVASLDNQLYYMLTGRSEFRDGVPSGSAPRSHVELMRYWHLASVYNSLFRTFSGLIIAIIMTEPTLIGEGEERFFTASHRLERSVDFLEEEGGAELDPQLVPLARQFIGFGNGESNFFDSLRHRLPLIASERQLLEESRQIHSGLQVRLDTLLDGILQDAVSPRGVSGAEPSPRTIALVLGILAAVVTLLAAASVARRNARSSS